MKRYIAILFVTLFSISSAFSQAYTITGKVVDDKTKEPIEFANIALPVNDLWAVSEKDGSFTLKQVPSGRTIIAVSCIGYARRELSVDVKKDIINLTITLSEDNLALKEVVVTAQRKASDATTTYTLDRNTIDHMQVLDVVDLASLLPGGQTSRKNGLASTDGQQFSLRSGASSEQGNASMGTAVEVDGIRLSNNGDMGNPDPNSGLSSFKGVDTRNISSSNIESVEIITGVPSVEYGDLTSGIVKVNTIRGKSPITVEFVTKPNTKQYTVAKGFLLGEKSGTLNVHAEHTKSVADIASPYTSYKRNIISLAYSNIINRGGAPIILKAGFTGNIGGYDSKADPDFYADTYLKNTDNLARGNVEINWLLNKPWITKLEASGSVNYNYKHWEKKEYKSSATSTPAIHATEEGYFMGETGNPDANIILIPAGEWYETRHDERKEFTLTGKIKASWNKKISSVNNRLVLGSDITRTGNNGRGVYYGDIMTAPTWREYKYSDLPYLDNMALYAEDQVIIPIQRSSLQLTAGVRSDITSVRNSDYGTVNSIAPRFNLKYNIPFRRTDFLRSIVLRAGYGEAVKLPSFDVLYPAPSYRDIQTFAPGTLSDGTIYYAYYSNPTKAIHNPDLKWQKNRLHEIGVDFNTKWANVSLSFYNNKTINPYVEKSIYSPFTYNYTPIPGSSFPIPANDRIYTIDPQTGIVIASDKTGIYPAQQLSYNTRTTVKSNSIRSNASPITRRGLEWVVDFAKISALKTTLRIDGKYYYYKGIDETLYAGRSSSVEDNSTYKYIGYYVGSSNSTSNGSVEKQLNTNLTITTHIPEVKLIVSLRVEACFYNYTQNLSGSHAFVLDSKDDYLPSKNQTDIYAGNQYIAIYPLYYVSTNDMNTKIPFTAELLADARQNNLTLYNDLVKLVNKSPYINTFNANKLSAYYTANISVTKEIGKYASITFNAKNFFNNMNRVRFSQTETQTSLYGSSLVPSFYYGLSLRIKI